jgi:hypothetical protein
MTLETILDPSGLIHSLAPLLSVYLVWSWWTWED